MKMAKIQLKGLKDSEERLLDGHKATYRFTVHRLDAVKRTFDPFEYNTECSVVPTSWGIELKYERMPENKDTYSVTLKLRRKDPSDHRVKATVFVTFYDIFDRTDMLRFKLESDKMVHDDEVEGAVDNIPQSEFSGVVTVRVSMLIEECHTEKDLSRARNAKTVKSINLSEL